MGYDSCNKSLYNNNGNLPPGFNDHSNDQYIDSFMTRRELRHKREVDVEIEKYQKWLIQNSEEIRTFYLEGKVEQAELLERSNSRLIDNISKLQQEKTK